MQIPAISTQNFMKTKSVHAGWRCIDCMSSASHAFNYYYEEEMPRSHHAEHKQRKLSPPVGCWFWVVPRSMLLEAFTCWSCHWFSPGVWGWAEEELWEFFLEEKKSFFFYVCLMFWEIKYLTCFLLKWFILHYTAMKHGLWELSACE